MINKYKFASVLLQSNARLLKFVEYIISDFWDTAGQERFKSITSAYYRGAVGALLVYDLTKGGSFDNITNWVQEMQNHSDPEIQVVLCLLAEKERV